MSDDLEDLLKDWLRRRGATDHSTVQAATDRIATLPSRRRGPGRSLAAAAAVIVAVGLAAFAFVPRLTSNSSQPSSPVSSDPAAFAGDPRLAACRAYVADPVQVFEMTHAQWFPLYFPGWWKGAPELEVDDPALVVVGREQRWAILGAPPQPGQTVDPDAGLGYQMCIAVGATGGFTAHDYGVTHFDRIVPILSDADIARAVHLDPDVLGDPAAWPFPERLGPCGGRTGNELYIFEASPLSDFPRYFPAVHPVPAMDVDEPGIVIVYRDPLLLLRRAGAPSGPAIKDVCVVFEESGGHGTSAILPEIDITGFHLRLDMPGASAPTPSATAPAEASPPVLTPEPGPAWAGDARAALTCAGEPSLFDTHDAPGSNAGAAATPANALTSYLQSVQFSAEPIPLAGFAEKELAGGALLYTTDVATGSKAAIVISSRGAGTSATWVVSSVAACDESEFDPRTPTGAHQIGLWTDATGAEVAASVLAGIADCYGGTQVRFQNRLYDRDPNGGVDPSQLETSWAADVAVPANAIGTQYRSGNLRLFIAADRRAIYFAADGRGERLPHAIHDEILRTDCN